MKKIKYIILALVMLATSAGFGVAVMQTNTGALDVFSGACTRDAADTAICKDRDKEQVPDYIKTIVNTMLYALAAVAVIIIILAGIYYTTSGGDPSLIKRAKDTLLYAVVGLIVAIMAYAIVNFVIGRFV
jgi:hypothetical protein